MAKPSETETKYRGQHMTRIETFVAAAFAFCLTMLVISVDHIPNNFDEFIVAAKNIPAFAASFAVITWIWFEHAHWCRRFGLEDGISVFLSCVLVFLVLIYVYPLRIMMQSLFAFISDGFFPFGLEFTDFWQLRFMFSFYALGFMALCATFIFLFRHTLAKAELLGLSRTEKTELTADTLSWMGTGIVATVSLFFALVLPLNWVSLSGFVYFMIFPVNTGIRMYYARKLRSLESSGS